MIAAGAAAEPRAISGAEREAVAIAAAFLTEGPRALWTRLPPAAPLRALPESEALAELDARTGPRAGARWTLRTVQGPSGNVAFHVTFPSGYSDGLLFRMRRAGSGWQLHEVLTLAEPLERPRIAAPPPKRSASTAPLIAAMLLGATALFVRGKLKAILAIAAAALLALAFFAPAAKPRHAPAFAELRALAPLRAQLARGDEARVPAGLTGEGREVGRLWLLQSGTRTEMPNVQRSQLSEIVRARIALAADRRDEAQAAFERALAMPPLRDDILLEAVQSLDGFRAGTRMEGSRDANLYYARAIQSASDGKTAEAQRDLATAWKLEPRPRVELVREPHLFALLHDIRLMSMVSFLGATEPTVRSASTASAPLAWPAAVKAFVCGELLRVELQGATLEVPGGAPLAPKDTRAVPATFWAEQEDAAALRDAASLLELPARSTTPAARTRVLRAARALAHHNRWAELLRLTDDVTPVTESLQPELLELRFRALLRNDRLADARALATGEAVRRLMQRPTHPRTLITVADAMTAAGAYDTALPLYQAVKSEALQELVGARTRQLELRRELARSGLTIATAHFDVRHDPRMNPAIASRIGDLLEAELARVQAKLAVTPPRRIVANVLFWENFREDITGSDHVVGLYDGEILFPFAVVQQFKPEVVSVIAHELTHALVAQATGDNAPRWFQEGVAQRMELVPMQENAFQDNSPLLVLPLPLLDAVMENAIDPYATEQGYKVAQTFIRFLETRFGPRALATLMAEFAKGRNTDDALKTLTGKSLDALNHDFRQWGFANNGHFRNDEPWPYRDFYSPGIDPRIREGFTWGKRTPARGD